ncbi:MAG: hypothetical protein JJ891_16910 [Rhizobiaceae bacterium]|nr:hypothetical protein [Rhizobiaceae bacterium]
MKTVRFIVERAIYDGKKVPPANWNYWRISRQGQKVQILSHPDDKNALSIHLSEIDDLIADLQTIRNTGENRS